MKIKLPSFAGIKRWWRPYHWWEGLLQFCRQNWKLLVAWGGIVVFIVAGHFLHLKDAVIVVVVFIFGLLSQAFSGLVALIALVPIVGPLIAKVLMLPIFWLLNALGYIVSVVAIKKGYKRDVINYRLLTIAFLIGFGLGFIIAQFF